MTADDAIRLGRVWRFNRTTFRAELLAVAGVCEDDGSFRGYLAAARADGRPVFVHPDCVYASKRIAAAMARQDAASVATWARERLAAAEAYLRDDPDGDGVVVSPPGEAFQVFDDVEVG